MKTGRPENFSDSVRTLPLASVATQLYGQAGSRVEETQPRRNWGQPSCPQRAGHERIGGSAERETVGRGVFVCG